MRIKSFEDWKKARVELLVALGIAVPTNDLFWQRHYATYVETMEKVNKAYEPNR